MKLSSLVTPKLLEKTNCFKPRKFSKATHESSKVGESDDDSADMSTCESINSFVSTCETIGSLSRKRKGETRKSRTASFSPRRTPWALDMDSPFIIDCTGRLLHKKTHVNDQNNEGRGVKKNFCILLLNIDAKQFEFVEVPLSRRKLTVRKVIEFATELATQPLLRVQRYNGLCRPVNEIQMANELHIGPNGCSIRNGEIVVALPEDHSMHECSIVGERIIMMPEVTDIFYRCTPFQETRSTLEPVQESTPSDTDTENLVTDIQCTGCDGAEECDLHDDEVIVQGISLKDKDADNTIADVALLGEMVQGISPEDRDAGNIFLEASSLAERTSSTAENNESEKTGLLTDEIDIAEFEQIVSEVPDEECSTLLVTTGMDLDEFMMDLSAVSEDEEYQDMEKATSKVSLSQNTCDEGSHSIPTVFVQSSCLDPEDTQRVKECDDTVYRQGNIEQDAVNHCEHIKRVFNSVFIMNCPLSKSVNIDYLPWVVFNGGLFNRKPTITRSMAAFQS